MQNTKEQTVKLEIRKYPKMIEAFASENFNLKTLLGVLIALLIVNSLVTVYLLKKGPEVIALEASGERGKLDTKISDLQIQAAIKEYISYRYIWSFETAKDQLKKAEFFVEPSLLQAFRKSMIEVQKFVQEKKINQRVYPKAVSVDLKSQMATITLDRFTEFEQLKAATEMKLILSFSISDRTPINPWGVYITKESESGSQ